jgi:hypothetical protein
MRDDRRGPAADDHVREAAKPEELEARRRAQLRAERLAVGELLAAAGRARRNHARRERLLQGLVDLS